MVYGSKLLTYDAWWKKLDLHPGFSTETLINEQIKINAANTVRLDDAWPI